MDFALGPTKSCKENKIMVTVDTFCLTVTIDTHSALLREVKLVESTTENWFAASHQNG
jgi:hypothetical protein